MEIQIQLPYIGIVEIPLRSTYFFEHDGEVYCNLEEAADIRSWDPRYRHLYQVKVTVRNSTADECVRHEREVHDPEVRGYRPSVVEADDDWAVVEVDLLPCQVCPQLDRWDERILSWLAENPDRPTILRTNPTGSWMCPPSLRPSEAALLLCRGVSPFSSWDHDEMRRFLEGEVDNPPLDRWLTMCREARQAGGEEALRDFGAAAAVYAKDFLHADR